jgi:hypothetical protein
MAKTGQLGQEDCRKDCWDSAVKEGITVLGLDS